MRQRKAQSKIAAQIGLANTDDTKQQLIFERLRRWVRIVRTHRQFRITFNSVFDHKLSIDFSKAEIRLFAQAA